MNLAETAGSSEFQQVLGSCSPDDLSGLFESLLFGCSKRITVESSSKIKGVFHTLIAAVRILDWETQNFFAV